jgi:fucose 4-O-acetylase-like acetyltransferase
VTVDVESALPTQTSGPRSVGAAGVAPPSGRVEAVTRARARRGDLDIAKGIGILLVVFGHLVARTPPHGAGWYSFLKDAVYAFHMAFFMYLSGYVTFMTGAARTPPPEWASLIRKRAFRLLLPFLLFGLAIVAGKWAASRFLYVDNVPSSGSQALLGLVWDTDSSPATSVWYILVLFVLCVVTPVLIWAGRGRLYLLTAVAAVLYLVPAPHVMYLDRIAHFTVFFVLGGLAAEAGERWMRAVDRSLWWTLPALVVLVVAGVWLLPFNGWQMSAKLFVCGVISMPALHGLARLRPLARSRILLTAGTYTFVIYLLNTPFIGLAKGLLMKLLAWDGAGFLVYAPVLMVAGTLGPILTKRLLLQRVRFLDRMTD